MNRFFLGVDVGATKSHALIIDEAGRIVGFGAGGTGNHENVGYDGLCHVLHQIVSDAAQQGGLERSQIYGAGFGLCGYDWPSEREAHVEAVNSLGLSCPIEVVNDAVPGLVAGAPEGWGVSVIAGTSCNCWGRDAAGRYGHVIGMGQMVGEAAGGGELVRHALWQVAYAYTRFGPPTQLTELFMAAAGVHTAEALLEAYTEGHVRFGAQYAPLVFQAAAKGDAVAADAIRWAGQELGNLAIAVIRQLAFHDKAFDVVLSGSLFKGSPLLHEAMQARVHTEAPYARFTHLTASPVIGAALLGMEQARCTSEMRSRARQALTAQKVV